MDECKLLGIDFLEFQLIKDDLEQAMTGISTHKQEDYADEFSPLNIQIINNTLKTDPHGPER